MIHGNFRRLKEIEKSFYVQSIKKIRNCKIFKRNDQSNKERSEKVFQEAFAWVKTLRRCF